MCEVKKKNIKETSPRRVPPTNDTTNTITVANNNELQLNYSAKVIQNVAVSEMILKVRASFMES